MMTKGRDVQPLEEFTFDTGITVQVRKTSPMLVSDIQKKFPPPPPPLNKVDYGDGNIKLEPNASDPAYIETLKAYQQEIEEKIRRVMIQRGVECEVDHLAVQDLRHQMRQEFDLELDPDDKFVYVAYICVGTAEDYNDLIQLITRRSQPTEDTVQAAVDSFRSHV